MVDSVAQYWAGDPSVTEMTDTELTTSRGFSTKISISSDDADQFHQLVATARREYDLSDAPEVLDFTLRVEVAHQFDTSDIDLTREDFDVRYLIPPRGWTKTQVFSHPGLADPETTGRAITVYTSPAVRAMVQALVEEGVVEDMSTLARTGVRRVTGRM